MIAPHGMLKKVFSPGVGKTHTVTPKGPKKPNSGGGFGGAGKAMGGVFGAKKKKMPSFGRSDGSNKPAIFKGSPKANKVEKGMGSIFGKKGGSRIQQAVAKAKEMKSKKRDPNAAIIG